MQPSTSIQHMMPRFIDKIESDLRKSHINITSFNSIKENYAAILNVYRDALDVYFLKNLDFESNELYFFQYIKVRHPDVYHAVNLADYFEDIEWFFKPAAQDIFSGKSHIPETFTCNKTEYHPHNLQEYFMAITTCSQEEHSPGKFDMEIASYKNYVIEQLGQNSLDF